MSSRAEALGRYLACGLALPLAALAADPVGQFQPTHVSVSPDRSAGLQALPHDGSLNRVVVTSF